MVKLVVKRDGTKETFDAEKIRMSVAFSARDAGLSMERITKVVDRVFASVMEFAESKEEIASAELAEKIVTEMAKLEPTAAEQYKKFEAARRKNSE